MNAKNARIPLSSFYNRNISITAVLHKGDGHQKYNPREKEASKELRRIIFQELQI